MVVDGGWWDGGRRWVMAGCKHFFDLFFQVPNTFLCVPFHFWNLLFSVHFSPFLPLQQMGGGDLESDKSPRRGRIQTFVQSSDVCAQA